MSSTFLRLFLAEMLFMAVVLTFVNFTKKPKGRKTHKEALRHFSAKESDGDSTGTFESHREKYIKAIREGRYKTKELACKDLYDLDQEFYQCLESVYFH